MKYIFEKTSGKNLDWLFSDLLKSTKKLDYKITDVSIKDLNSVEIEIKNNGEINGPLSLSQIKNNKIISSKWIEGFSGKTKIVMPCDHCDQFRIDAEERMPEIYTNNNSIQMNGILKKMEQLKFSFGSRTDNSNYTFISYLPVVGWNNYNKFMAGIVLHNISLYEKKFEYRLMPLYAFGTKDLEGGGDISYHLYPKNSSVYRITLRTGISRYAFGRDYFNSVNDDFQYSAILHYTKLDSRIVFSLMQKNRQDHFSNEITLRNTLINRDVPYLIDHKKESKIFLYWQAEFKRKNSNPLKKSLQKINISINKNSLIATGETESFLSYGSEKQGLELRFFGGYSYLPERYYGIDYRMNLNGRSGMYDYLFDEAFLGRSEIDGILSKQFVNDYAGFKSPTSFFRQAQKWMFGFNVNTTLPGFIPFRLFANTGIFDNSDFDGRFGKISWELGVDLPIIKDIFVISLPFAYSDDIKYLIDKEKLKPLDLIRFELHLNMLNPLNFIKNIYSN